MKLIACYGSLKKGYYNHPAVGTDAEFMGNSSVSGVMYSNGSYPKLYHADNGAGNTEVSFGELLEKEHTLEVYNVNDDAFRRINQMEIGAGYVAEEVETEWGTAVIWYMPHEHFSSHDKWVEKY